MADFTTLCDIGHDFGGDVRLSPTGDLLRVTGNVRSAERVYRRLLTNPGDYIWHPDYGAGLPQKVGGLVDVAEIRALIRRQMMREASVQQTPTPPAIVATAIPNCVSVQISYVALPDRQPTALSFSVSV